MPKFQFSKLVRDAIVDQQIASGAVSHFRTLSKSEHQLALIHKLREEAGEIEHADSSQLVSEIADVQQVLDDLKELCGITDKEVRTAQSDKNKKSGAFKKGHFVEYVEVDEDNVWTEYYRKNKDRYPEINEG